MCGYGMRADTGRAVPDLRPYLKARTGVVNREELLRKGQKANASGRREEEAETSWAVGYAAGGGGTRNETKDSCE